MNDSSLPRPTVARPVQGIYLGSPRNQPLLSPPVPPFTPPPTSPGSSSSLGTTGRGPVATLEDPVTVAELDRLADERNIAELLQYGFANGSATLRLTLSPRAVHDDAGNSSMSDDEWSAATEENKSSLGKVFGKLRKRPQRPLIITSEDNKE